MNAPGVAQANPNGRCEINWDGVPDGDFAFDFFVPGTQRRGPVSAFGAVFANVALPFVGGLSFVGAVLENKIIAKVRVSPGTAILGEPDEPLVTGRNLVFGEPLTASEN